MFIVARLYIIGLTFHQLAIILGPSVSSPLLMYLSVSKFCHEKYTKTFFIFSSPSLAPSAVMLGLLGSSSSDTSIEFTYASALKPFYRSHSSCFNHRGNSTHFRLLLSLQRWPDIGTDPTLRSIFAHTFFCCFFPHSPEIFILYVFWSSLFSRPPLPTRSCNEKRFGSMLL